MKFKKRDKVKVISGHFIGQLGTVVKVKNQTTLNISVKLDHSMITNPVKFNECELERILK